MTTEAPGTRRGSRPWYREPYVWLVIAFPLSAVLGSAVTIGLAIASSDGLVVDDYYRRGLAINQVLTRDRAAERLGLRADMDLNLAAGRIEIALGADPGFTYPQRVAVLFSHATRSGYDRRLDLERDVDGVYRGALAPLAAGRWYVQIAAGDWRLVEQAFVH